MARLTRKNIKVFAGSSNNNGIFGSLQANNPVLTNDVEQIQSLTAWEEGWESATETSEELPPIEEMNSISYVTTYEQAYIMQEGMPEWSANVTFYKGSLTKEVTSSGFRIYCSLTDNNLGNLLSDTSNWKKIMDSDDLYAFDSNVVKLTGNQTIGGIKTFNSSPVIPTPDVSDNSTNAATTAYVRSLLSAIYPIGSVFIGTTSTCPLASFFGTWTLKSTGIVTNIDPEVSVAGNGNLLGLTAKPMPVSTTFSSDYSLASNTPSSPGVDNYSNTLIATRTRVNNHHGESAYAIDTDSTKSGIEGTVTRSIYTVNIWERTA